MRHALLAFVFWSLPLLMHAQFCTGTLGDNIFLEGNFGNGTPNLLSPNPGIAPGYTYTFNVPPVDGQYVITNNTAVWSGLYPSWLAIGDNSADNDGYMMVVNASNEPGLFYEQTVSGLCENTLYEFSADIINLIKVGIPDHIDPNVSFLLNDVELFSTGDIPKTNNWTTYGFTFTTEVGQETLTLSLRNNAPGGNGNDLAIDNISFRACGPETFVAPTEEVLYLCEEDAPIELQATIMGDQYINPVFQWQESLDGGLTWTNIAGENGMNYTHPPLSAGVYYYRFVVADGVGNLASDNCRVNSIPKIIEMLAAEVTQSQTICEGQSLLVGNSVYTETGIYMDTFVNFLGCDSILITDLTVTDAADFMVELSVLAPCPNLADGSISIENISGGTPPFNYTFEGMDLGTTTFFPNLAGGETYSLIIEDATACPMEMAIFVENSTNLTLELGENQSIELGETVEITPVYNFTPSGFQWQSSTPIECLDFADCATLDFLPTSSQQVQLDLLTENGCLISDSLFIEVIVARKVWFPNAFSPNDDGVNDVFTVFGDAANVQAIEDFQIFDRWGNLIFASENFPPNTTQNAWDGTLNGKSLQTGVYIYAATVRFVDEEVERYSGDVLLVR